MICERAIARQCCQLWHDFHFAGADLGSSIYFDYDLVTPSFAVIIGFFVPGGWVPAAFYFCLLFSNRFPSWCFGECNDILVLQCAIFHFLFSCKFSEFANGLVILVLGGRWTMSRWVRRMGNVVRQLLSVVGRVAVFQYRVLTVSFKLSVFGGISTLSVWKFSVEINYCDPQCCYFFRAILRFEYFFLLFLFF